MRRYLISFALIVTGCGGNGSTTSTSVPASSGATPSGSGSGGTTGVADGGMPIPSGGRTGGDMGTPTGDMGTPADGGSGGCSTTPVAIASAEAGAAGIAVDDNNVYFLATAMPSTYTPWNLWRAPIDGGPAVEIGTTGSSNATDVTVNATTIFTLDQAGRLLRWPKAGGAPAVLQPSNTNVGVGCLADAFGSLYYCTDDDSWDQIVRTPEDGGPGDVVASGHGLNQIAFEPGWLSISSIRGTRGSAIDGSAAISISWSGNSPPMPLAVDGQHVFAGTFDGEILSAPKQNGAAFAVMAHTLMYPSLLHTDGGNLYVLASETVDGGGNHSAITRFSSDGSQTAVLADRIGTIGGMAFRGDSIYYTFDSDSTVYRICK